jgi:hypothetical protein
MAALLWTKVGANYSPDGAEDLLDVLGGRAGVTAGNEEEVTVRAHA